MLPTIFFYITIFLFGIVIGSFLNVCIYRIPNKENIVTTPSHCMNCGYRLKWFDLIPIFSYLVYGGKCRECKTKLSVQYPLIEALNGVLYLMVVIRFGVSIESLLYCFLFSALLVLSVIDFRTYEIPVGINVFILMLGLVRVAADWENWADYAIGFLAVSSVLYVIYRVSGGMAIGGGDVKLMATCGLLLGWQLILFGFVMGCILGSIIHVIRMKVSGESKVLAFGPYLAMGVAIAVLYGNEFLAWYLQVYLGM